MDKIQRNQRYVTAFTAAASLSAAISAIASVDESELADSSVVHGRVVKWMGAVHLLMNASFLSYDLSRGKPENAKPSYFRDAIAPETVATIANAVACWLMVAQLHKMKNTEGDMASKKAFALYTSVAVFATVVMLLRGGLVWKTTKSTPSFDLQ